VKRRPTEASVRQRRVSAELRALRKARGYTCQQVADALECSVTKISRMETGDRGLFADDVSAILGFLQAPAKLREELLKLARTSDQRNWIHIGGKLPTAWKQLIEFENSAIAIYNYEPLVVPGLLQTDEYAREVIRAGNGELSEPEVDTFVRTRMGRRELLSRAGGPTLNVIIDETVLHRPIGGPAVMHGQLQHLLAMLGRSKVDIRIIPFTVGANPGLEGPAMLLEFANLPSLVHVEIRGGTCLLEEPSAIRSVKIAWQTLKSMALSAEDSARLIATTADKLT
jgi:transcriptional regulator with XRE-family HTH domain